MAPRRRRRRPWYRTRAYRLTRTALLTVVLVTVGVRCTGDHNSTAPYGPDGQDTVAAAGPDAEVAVGPDVEMTAGPDVEMTGGRDAEVTGGPDAEMAGGQDPEVTGGQDPEVTRGPGSSARPTPTRTPALRPLPRSRPTSFRIPSLGIDAPITGLGLIKGRELATPPVDKPKLVGWYQGGPTPGETGTAIAVGHRDTRSGPAVFAALAQVKPGKVIEARRADGRTAVYTVDRVKVFDKEGFPDKEVYGPARRPELRVITCGGLFKWRTGYTSNVVVFAHLTGTREPRPAKSATAR
ncbi:class F sortase [Streptomyces canus]|uniref:class F sortase n=1 Tax=Streptomyces canus TaxID=58343 RepID=UPI00367B7F9E